MRSGFWLVAPRLGGGHLPKACAHSMEIAFGAYAVGLVIGIDRRLRQSSTAKW